MRKEEKKEEGCRDYLSRRQKALESERDRTQTKTINSSRSIPLSYPDSYYLIFPDLNVLLEGFFVGKTRLNTSGVELLPSSVSRLC